MLYIEWENCRRLNLTVMELISRFTVYRDSGCWEFYGRFNTQGYGQIEYQGRMQLVHRISYRLMRGKIPKGKFVLHSCDNRKCYNPDHLWIGTQADNMKDMRDKGRQDDFGRKLAAEVDEIIARTKLVQHNSSWRRF